MGERMNSQRAPRKYFCTLDRIARPRSNFDAALCALLRIKPLTGKDGARDGRRARMVAALDHRATWRQIRRWRRNESPAPAWARELLARELESISAEARLYSTAPR